MTKIPKDEETLNKLDNFCCRLPGDIDYIGPLVEDVIDYLEGSYGEMDECTLFEIRVILNELLLNAVKHGIKGDKNRYVKVIAGLKRNGSAMIMVEDEGDGCDYSFILKDEDECCHSTEDVLYQIKETGRGLLIVRGLCERIRFNRKGNRVLVVKKLRRAGK